MASTSLGEINFSSDAGRDLRLALDYVVIRVCCQRLLFFFTVKMGLRFRGPSRWWSDLIGGRLHTVSFVHVSFTEGVETSTSTKISGGRPRGVDEGLCVGRVTSGAPAIGCVS